MLLGAAKGLASGNVYERSAAPYFNPLTYVLWQTGKLMAVLRPVRRARHQELSDFLSGDKIKVSICGRQCTVNIQAAPIAA